MYPHTYLGVPRVFSDVRLDLIVFEERLPHPPYPPPVLPSRGYPLQETRPEGVGERPPELVGLLPEGVGDAVLPCQVLQVVVFAGAPFPRRKTTRLIVSFAL